MKVPPENCPFGMTEPHECNVIPIGEWILVPKYLTDPMKEAMQLAVGCRLTPQEAWIEILDAAPLPND